MKKITHKEEWAFSSSINKHKRSIKSRLPRQHWHVLTQLHLLPNKKRKNWKKSLNLLTGTSKNLVKLAEESKIRLPLYKRFYCIITVKEIRHKEREVSFLVHKKHKLNINKIECLLNSDISTVKSQYQS